MFWSTPMWNLYHTLCEKSADSVEMRKQVYQIIYKLSDRIPCTICKIHSIDYLKKRDNSIFKSKESFKLFFYNFHNNVKQSKKLPLELEDVLDKYKTMDLNVIYIEVVEMLVLFGMKDDFTTNINDLYLKIFDNLDGAKDINSAYMKDPINKKRILNTLGIKDPILNTLGMKDNNKNRNRSTKRIAKTLKVLLMVGLVKYIYINNLYV